MGHHHDHDHDHPPHPPTSRSLRRVFLVGIILNLAFVVIEVTFGIFSHSLALIADGGHNFSDVVGLVLSWVAFWLAEKKPSEKYTYGFRRTSILASLANSVLLLVSVGIIFVEAIQRWRSPQPVDSGVMIWVALAGIVLNTTTAILFLRDRHHDLNVKSAFTHMAGDALISLGVVVTGILIHYTQLNWLDPVMSMLISLVIVWGTWSLLTESTLLAIDGVPNKVQPAGVRTYLEQTQGVLAIHDLHIWGLSTTEVALTVHLVVDSFEKTDQILAQICTDLKSQFQIDHPTIQFESSTSSQLCDLKPDEEI